MRGKMKIAKAFLNTGINLVLLARVDNFPFQKSSVADFYYEVSVG